MIIFELFLVLKSVSLFKYTPDDMLTHVALAVREVRVPAGHTIVTQGEAGSTMYIIVEGKTKVCDGDHVLVELHARDVFGELAALSPTSRISSVIAVEDTFLLAIEHDALYDLMSMNRGLTKGVIEFLCNRIRQVAEQNSHHL